MCRPWRLSNRSGNTRIFRISTHYMRVVVDEEMVNILEVYSSCSTARNCPGTLMKGSLGTADQGGA